MDRLFEIVADHPMLAVGGGLAVFLLIALSRKGGGGWDGDLPPNMTALQIESVRGNTQVALAGLGLRGSINENATAVRLAQIQAPVALALGKAQISSDERIAAQGFALSRELARISANSQRSAANTAANINQTNQAYDLVKTAIAAYGAYAVAAI